MKLYLIPSPIGENNSDLLPPIVHKIIAETKYYLVENERTTRRFISSLNLNLNIRELVFFRLDKNTKTAQIATYFSQIPKDENVGVISEAGCPGIADPGALAVAFAHQHNIEVEPVTGPSSIFLALMSAGFSGQNFVFHGYLPIEKTPRTAFIKKMESEVNRSGQSQIFMETPYRNNALFQLMIEVGNPSTRLCIASDISGPHQLIKTQNLSEWKKEKVDLNKKPTIFLIG